MGRRAWLPLGDPSMGRLFESQAFGHTVHVRRARLGWLSLSHGVFSAAKVPMSSLPSPKSGPDSAEAKKTTLSSGKFIAVVGLAVAAPLMILFAAAELSATVIQHYAESGAAGGIGAMRAEQRWLVAQGLAKTRPIGSFGASVWNKGLYDPIGTHVQKTPLFGGHELSGLARSFEPLDSMASHGIAISVDGDASEVFAGDAMGLDAARRATYRHEEGHALMMESPGPIGPLPGMPADASKIASAAMESISAGKGSLDSQWRGVWLATVRSEALADAYSCLSVARRGQEALRECALSTHAARIFPSFKQTSYSSLDVAGNSHGVDMASFLAAQLDARSVARLDARGLSELCSKIADASVSWSVARQPGALGFFDEAGAGWWKSEAAKAGVPAAQASLAWALWRESSFSDKPEAVFGSHSWTVSGMEFKARGLPESIASSRWRFDGEGGMSIYSKAMDPGKAASPKASGRTDAGKAIAQEARSAALLIHKALAETIGADAALESQRLAMHASGPLPTPLNDAIGAKLSERRAASAQKPVSLPKAAGI